MAHRSIRTIVALAFALAGCKASTADTCGTLFDAFQSYATACVPQYQTFLGTRDRYVLACKLEVDAPGTKGYAAALDKCSAAIKSAQSTCTADLGSCDIPSGTLLTGAGCGNDAQCETSFCQVTATTSACGKCAAVIAVGASCTVGVDHCAKDSTCVTSAAPGSGAQDSGTCVANTKAAVGASCASRNVSCTSDAHCDSDTKLCVAQGDLGATCSFASQCKNPLACSNRVCVTGKTSGVACSVDEHGQTDCVPSLVCTSAGICSTAAYGAAGAQCDDISTFCEHGSCVRNSDRIYVCPEIIPDGGACDDNVATSQCGDDASCMGGKCTVFNPATCQ